MSPPVRPCATCPYSRATPLGIWDAAEYDNLRRHDADPISGEVFGCHQGRALPPAERTLCIGWLADQKRRGVPSIRLRLRLMTGRAELALYEGVDEHDPDLYGSIDEMVKANAGIPFPKNAAVRRKLRGKKKETHSR